MMKIAVWLHQFDNGYPGLVGSDDSQLPFSAVYGKTNDGTRWQSTWDRHGVAIGEAADVTRAERDIYAPQGIEYVPWGVIAGRSEAGSVAGSEGTLAGQIAKAAAGPGERATYIVDLEPSYHGGATPQFWRDDLGAGPAEVSEFIGQFMRNGGQEIWIAPDARDPHLSPVAFEAWWAADIVTRVLPQVYYTDFSKPRTATAADAKAAIDTAVATLEAHGVRQRVNIHPILPADSEPGVLVGAIRYCHEIGCGGVSIWQRGNMGIEVAQAIAAMEDPWAAPEPAVEAPKVDIAAIRREAEAMQASAARILELTK